MTATGDFWASFSIISFPGVHEFVFNLGKLVKREKGEIGTIP